MAEISWSRSQLRDPALPSFSASGSSSSGSAGDKITDILDQLLNGNTDNTGSSGDQSVQLQELPGNYMISVTLGYKLDLIQAEQARKGLDHTAKVEKVEVAG